MVGRTISHYEILDELGKGGMGVVYCARDVRLDRLVALKILPAEHMSNLERRSRFVREARTASALNHPNIITIYEIETVDDVDYIAMEFVRGSTLRELIPPAGLPVHDALGYASQVAAGLAVAHAAGIVHRDIKPANIMVGKSGVVKLLDFGIAQVEPVAVDRSATTGTMGAMFLTRPGTILGTTAYLSPEQAQAKELDQRSDISSFGIVLYQMLTGALPFQAASELALMHDIVYTPAPPASQTREDLPLALDRVLHTALAKDPAQRYPCMEDLLADLNEVRAELEQGRKPKDVSRARTLVPKRSWRRPIAIAALAVSLLLVFAAVLWKVAPGWFVSVPAEKKIAVLPFRNIGDNRENEAFRDGLMEALTSELTELSQFHGTLWVVPATEVRKGAFTSAKDANRALGVNLVITGSVQRDSGSVLLRANLVDATTLRQLRSREIRRPIDAVANLQESLVQEVAGMLQLELGARERQILAAGETNTSSAYDLYLQARGHLQRRQKGDVDRAAELFQQAVARDPKYALAYAGLGEAFWWKYRDSSDTRSVESAQKNCKLALGLNDRLAPVYVTLGIIDAGTGRHEDAIEAFKRAMELDPINASAHVELAGVYEKLGKFDDAAATYKKAVELRPGDWTSVSAIGAYYFRRGQYQDALANFRRVTELAPDNSSGYSNMGAVSWMQGQYRDAAASFEKSLALRPTATAYSNLGTIYFFMDRCAEAIPLMEKAAELLPKNDQYWGNLADAYACVPADKEKAIKAYERATQFAQERLAVNPNDADTVARLALYQARVGRKAEALAGIEKARQLTPASRQVCWHAALVYELGGKRDLALKSLGVAYRSGQPVEEIRREPALASLRNDPRYAGLISDHSVKP